MRLLYLIKKEFIESKRSLVIYAITIISIVGGLAILRTTFNQYAGGGSEELYGGLFSGFLFLGGAIYTSTLFSDDMFNRVRVHNFLMLPASQEEKFLARLIDSAIMYPIIVILLFAFTSIVAELLLFVTLKDPITLFNPLSKEILMAIPSYIVLHSLFFLGATYFRKIHFIKTVFTSWTVMFSFVVILFIFVRIILAPYFLDQSVMYIRVSFLEQYNSLPKLAFTIGKFFYFIILPLYLYFISYLRIKEVQATDAIQ